MRSLFLFETGVVILLGLLLFFRAQRGNVHDKSNSVGAIFNSEQIKYVYLVQTSSGYNRLTDSLKSTDKADVLVLSWDSNTKADIVVSSVVPWPERRNMLYIAALHSEAKLNRKYEYFIFVDDLPTHIDLRPSTRELPASETWRTFESYLAKYTPAIGVLSSSRMLEANSKISIDTVQSVGIFEEVGCNLS